MKTLSALEENTEALRELIAVLKAQGAASPRVIIEGRARNTGPDGALALVAAQPVDIQPSPNPITEASTLTLRLSASKGRDAALGLLGKYGARKLDEIPLANLSTFVAEAYALLGASPPVGAEQTDEVL